MSGRASVSSPPAQARGPAVATAAAAAQREAVPRPWFFDGVSGYVGCWDASGGRLPDRQMRRSGPRRGPSEPLRRIQRRGICGFPSPFRWPGLGWPGACLLAQPNAVGSAASAAGIYPGRARGMWPVGWRAESLEAVCGDAPPTATTAGWEKTAERRGALRRRVCA
jgi:hypothetical protein